MNPISLRHRLRANESRWCLRANALCDRRTTLRFFAAVSRLGDGVFWYALMAMLALFGGAAGRAAALHMIAVGAVSLVLYKALKAGTRRPRPCAADLRIRARVAPLDEFSFPSGHTLHAVAFTIVALAYVPALAWLLIPPPPASPPRAWCWACTTRATSSPRRDSAVRWQRGRSGCGTR
jgi:undecaprenyl-diphosphatase